MLSLNFSRMTTLAQVERYISILENEIERAKFFKENLISYKNEFFLVENEEKIVNPFVECSQCKNKVCADDFGEALLSGQKIFCHPRCKMEWDEPYDDGFINDSE